MGFVLNFFLNGYLFFGTDYFPVDFLLAPHLPGFVVVLSSGWKTLERSNGIQLVMFARANIDSS